MFQCGFGNRGAGINHTPAKGKSQIPGKSCRLYYLSCVALAYYPCIALIKLHYSFIIISVIVNFQLNFVSVSYQDSLKFTAFWSFHVIKPVQISSSLVCLCFISLKVSYSVFSCVHVHAHVHVCVCVCRVKFVPLERFLSFRS